MSTPHYDISDLTAVIAAAQAQGEAGERQRRDAAGAHPGIGVAMHLPERVQERVSGPQVRPDLVPPIPDMHWAPHVPGAMDGPHLISSPEQAYADVAAAGPALADLSRPVQAFAPYEPPRVAAVPGTSMVYVSPPTPGGRQGVLAKIKSLFGRP